jgi:hypothetical protein
MTYRVKASLLDENVDKIGLEAGYGPNDQQTRAIFSKFRVVAPAK